MQIYEQTSEINKACLVISQRVQAMFARSANIRTNERDKQGMPCYFTESAGYVRAQRKYSNKRAR